jgi:hypothetical protein
MTIGRWDILLWVVVSVLGTAVAYLRAPRWKALLVALPLPFTVAVLAVGQPVGTSNVAGLIVLLAFVHAVRWLHDRSGVAIVAAIVIATAGYCLFSLLLKPWLPIGGATFWVTCAASLSVAGVLHGKFPSARDRDYRTPLPAWVKLPILSAVVAALVAVKHLLGGFTTVFPMVGVITAYEARHGLRTVCRQIPVYMFAMVPMIAAIHVAQTLWSTGTALAVGWMVFLTLFIPLQRRLWRDDTAGGASAV